MLADACDGIPPVRRLVLVSHRPIDQAGGPAARWRSFAKHLPSLGWEVDVVSGGGGDEFRSPKRAQTRAKVMETAGRIADPVFRLAGLRPEALPLSTAWGITGAGQVRGRLAAGQDVVLATGPPFAALVAARRAHGNTPLVVELRDLWAGNPAFDRGGPFLRKLESWVVRQAAAVVAVTPEAVADLRRRHPDVRVEEIPNGFEPELLERRRPTEGPATTILHSGTLTKDRPLAPLLRELRPPLRLVLHGYVAPEIQAEIEASSAEVELVPPSGWEDAVERIAAADVALITQSRGAGDETAVAAKVYEYLALGKPVLCLSDGGATEALLSRLGVDQLCARLDDPASIEAALARIAAVDLPAPVPTEKLASYERLRLAQRLAELLDAVAA
jgi:glycosyltransferase involved in cell wall biosynthesis